MKFSMQFDMDNAAFKTEDEPPEIERAEVAAILRKAAVDIENYWDGMTIKDSNGNSVGNWNIEAGVNDPEYLG